MVCNRDIAVGIDLEAVVTQSVGNCIAVRVVGKGGDPNLCAGTIQFVDCVGGRVGIGHITNWAIDQMFRLDFSVANLKFSTLVTVSIPSGVPERRSEIV